MILSCDWCSFQPGENRLVTANGDTVTYDWLVIATGLVLRSDMEHYDVKLSQR